MTGGQLPEYHLALWHGITPALVMNLVAFAGDAAYLERVAGRAAPASRMTRATTT
ncbi:hypothetical protein [Xanthobacter flavus]|uniref:hypothetical protein n=1 Tax=Xanthobacter flavus TaxID=281 RepID=UPI003726DC33